MKGLLFTYALAYGGSVAAVFNPFIGLLIYVCFAITRPEVLWGYSVPVGNYSRIIALSLLIGWGIKKGGDWNFGRSVRILLCLVGFLCWMAVAATVAAYPDVAWVRVEALAKVVLPFFVGMTAIRSPKQLKMLIWVIVVSEGYLSISAQHGLLRWHFQYGESITLCRFGQQRRRDHDGRHGWLGIFLRTSRIALVATGICVYMCRPGHACRFVFEFPRRNVGTYHFRCSIVPADPKTAVALCVVFCSVIDWLQTGRAAGG